MTFHRSDGTRRHAGAVLGVVTALVLPAGAPAAATDLRMPDTRDAAAAAQPYVDLRMPDTRDAANRLAQQSERQPIVISVDKSSGFDWGDATIGAGAGIGIALLAGGLTAIGGRRRAARRATTVAATSGR